MHRTRNDRNHNLGSGKDILRSLFFLGYIQDEVIMQLNWNAGSVLGNRGYEIVSEKHVQLIPISPLLTIFIEKRRFV